MPCIHWSVTLTGSSTYMDVNFFVLLMQMYCDVTVTLRSMSCVQIAYPTVGDPKALICSVWEALSAQEISLGGLTWLKGDLTDGRPGPEALLYWENGGVLFGQLGLHAFEVFLMMQFFCPAGVMWEAWGEGDTFLGSCRLWLLWVHGMACMRRNHINFQVMKNDYKKLGCKKPGLWMEDSFVILFFFCGRTWTGRQSSWAQKVSFVLLPLLLSYPLKVLAWNNLRLLGQTEMRLLGWDEMKLLGQDKTRLLGLDRTRLLGQDDTGLLGWDNMKLLGWDKMGWGKTWMTSWDETMGKDLKKMILFVKIKGWQCSDGCPSGNTRFINN